MIVNVGPSGRSVVGFGIKVLIGWRLYPQIIISSQVSNNSVLGITGKLSDRRHRFGLGRTGLVRKYGRRSLWMNVALRQLFDC